MKKPQHALIVVLTILSCTAIAWAGPKPSGDYLLNSFNDEIQGLSADRPEAGFHRIALDGSGDGSFQDIELSVGPPLESGSFDYLLYPTGALRLFPSENLLHGVVSPDAQFLAIVSVHESEPEILFGVKKPSAPLSMTSKTYIAAQFSDDVTNPGVSQSADEPSVKLMQITLAPGGNGMFQDLYDSTGEIENGSFTYAIDNTPVDGNLTVTIVLPPPEPTLVFTGIISQDGSVFSFPFTIPYEPGFIVGIEKSNGDMDTSKAKGTYILCQLADEIDNPGPGQTADSPVASIIEVTLDGKGQGTFKGLYSSRSAGGLDSGTFSYSLNANGEISVSTSGGGPINGVMSKNGELLILAETAADFPAISIGIKKSAAGSSAIPLLLLNGN